MKDSRRLREFLELIEAEDILELDSKTRTMLVERLHFVRGSGKPIPHMQLNDYVSEQETAGLIGRERSEDQIWCLMLTEMGSAKLADLRGATPAITKPELPAAERGPATAVELDLVDLSEPEPEVVASARPVRRQARPGRSVIVRPPRPLTVAPPAAPELDEPTDRALANFLELASVAPSPAGRAFWAAKAAARQLALEVNAACGNALPVSAA
ncbi:MAG TPA: hypothetical protein VLI05_04505 [Candidatus Saccharimonadia bacterium]|nr:hypothetical protein [Candidatus Saccharimonadia bacterium]